MNILLVDDEPDFREACATSLRHQGHVVVTAFDGRDGLYKFGHQDFEFDVVISDWNMPYMNGVTMVTLILKMEPRTRAVMMSGDWGNKPPAGVPLLRKPFSLEDLLNSLRP